MASVCVILFILLQLSISYSEDAACSADSETCKDQCDVNKREENETLGHYLLRKQEASYKSTYRPSTAMSVRMVNPNNKYYDVYWYIEHRNPSRIFKGSIKPNSMRSTNSYQGHIFYFTERGAKPEDELWRFEVTKGINMYIFEPVLDTNDPFYIQVLEQKTFLEQYQKDTGRAWIHHYPRPKPFLNMWSVHEGLGYIHSITTPETPWNCIPDDFQNDEAVSACRDREPITMGVEVISQEPRIFVIENVVSDAEGALIIELATKKLIRSRAGGDGGMEDNTRTSRTAWLGRTEHPVMDTIYRRAADLLGIDEALLYSHKNVEQLQVVHYDVGEEYKAHHDFGDHGEITSRMITLLFYLNEMVDDDSGGQTLFPKANNGKGVGVHPGKGNAVLFYSLLEDGNGDDKSLHEAVKLIKGEKWICNFWVWDPHR